MYSVFTLSGNNTVELDTEIKFNIAAARVDGVELVRLSIASIDDERECDRLRSCATKVLRALRREGAIQFFVENSSLSDGSTESMFLFNKYGDFISKTPHDSVCFFVKT